MLIILFLVSHSNFLFVPCGRLSWLPVSFLLHVKYPLLYRIVFVYLLTHFCSTTGDDYLRETYFVTPCSTQAERHRSFCRATACSLAMQHGAAFAVVRCLAGWLGVYHIRVLCWNSWRYGHSYHGKRIENRIQSFELYHFQWPWVTSNADFRVTVFSTSNNSK